MCAPHLRVVVVPGWPLDRAVVDRLTVLVPDYGSPEANMRAAQAAFDCAVSLAIPSPEQAACVLPITGDTLLP